MKEIRDINILAIETSCDETAAAVVHNGREVLSNVISSQIDLHKLYGGVVPEIASRKHIEKINQVIEEGLKEAEVTLDDIDAVGVTYGPGLVGALLVGVAEAKAIASRMPGISLWWGCIISRGISLRIISSIRIWSRPSSVSSRQAGIPISCVWRSTGNMRSSGAHGTMRLERRMTRSPVRSAWDIRADRRSTGSQKKEIRMQ